MKKSLSALRNELSSLTRTANNRLRSLEREGLARSSNAYRWVRDMAYDEADYLTYTTTGKPKFRRDVSNMSEQEIKEAIKNARNFLEAKTSTPTRTHAKYDKAWTSYNERMQRQGRKQLTFEEYTELHEEAVFTKYLSRYSSKEARQIVDEHGKEKAVDIMNTIIELDERRELEGKNELTVIERLRIIENDGYTE